VLDQEHDRGRVLAADREALHHPQHHQQDGGRRSELGVIGKQANQEGGNGHRQHRGSQRGLAANAIAEMSEDHSANRPHQEPGGEDAEGGNQRGGRVFGRKEVPADDGSEVAVDGEVVPLHHIAGDAREGGATANCGIVVRLGLARFRIAC
jgi:hypothetical protein